jgi:S-formylglutathione hydrolase FrmB
VKPKFITLVAVVAVVAIAALAVSRLVGDVVGADERGAEVSTLAIHSRSVGATLDTTVIVPDALEDAKKPPLLVFLHGRGGEGGSEASNAFYAALDSLGSRAPVVAMPDGGDHSYWHDRHGGRRGSYVLREAIPAAVRRLPVDSSRVAIGGISMGGYGAFELARHRRFCAVGGHSPAFWLSSGQTAPGAFDDARDFRRHSVYRYVARRRHPYGSMPLWIDRGKSDPFTSYDGVIVRALRDRGARLTSHVWPGAHTGKYWRAHMARYLRFYARALAHC